MAVVATVKHAINRTVSVVAVLLVGVGLGWAVYAGVIRPILKPVPSTHQSGVITNNYINPTADELATIVENQVAKRDKFFIGIKLWGWKLGILK